MINSFNTALIVKLKSGSIPRVVLYGDTDKMPDAPYVVVKAESGAIAGTRQFRIIAHANMGLQDELENYLNIELSTLLIKDGNEKVFIIDGAGNRYRLQSSGAGTETIMGNDDGTIAMERIFSLPTMFE